MPDMHARTNAEHPHTQLTYRHRFQASDKNRYYLDLNFEAGGGQLGLAAVLVPSFPQYLPKGLLVDTVGFKHMPKKRPQNAHPPRKAPGRREATRKRGERESRVHHLKAFPLHSQLAISLYYDMKVMLEESSEAPCLVLPGVRLATSKTEPGLLISLSTRYA